MSEGLPVSRLISVDVNLAPTAAQAPNLNRLVIIGSSDVIDTDTRVVSFTDLASIATAFGTSAPEYKAAALWYAQRPSPIQLYIGRWAETATKGLLVGGALSPAQQLLSVFTAVANGGFKIGVDGNAVVNVTGINLTGVTNLNGVASQINAALVAAPVAASVAWDGLRFTFKSNTTGIASEIAPLQAPNAGTNLAPLMNGTLALGARAVNGIAAESALAAVSIIDSLPTGIYAFMFAATAIDDSDHLDVAGYIEAASRKHVYGLTSSSPGALDSAVDTDIGSLLKAAGYTRTVPQFSNTPYAVASLFGRILTTNFDANSSMITLMFKQEPGVTAELLTTQQADSLEAKNYNVFVAYDNDTAIIQYGVVSSGLFFDEVYGTDWLRYRVQNDLFNALYTNTRKIPQTDAGMAILATVIEGSLAAAVNNGLVGPGYWTDGGFGQLSTGDFLSSGFYVYTPPIATQSVSDRAARKSVAYVVAAKLAGAVHSVDVLINVNR